MPINPKYKEYYKPPEWTRIRDAILLRDGGRCKRCTAPDKVDVYRSIALPAMWYDKQAERWRNGEGCITTKMLRDLPERRRVAIVLTIAHLNHDPRDNRKENLAALCQMCHLKHDRKQHAATARRTRALKRKQMWLLPEIEAAARAVGL